ncbi:MAG: hypothetical protein U0235_33280 [Polyangiaceae bacterium]
MRPWLAVVVLAPLVACKARDAASGDAGAVAARLTTTAADAHDVAVMPSEGAPAPRPLDASRCNPGTSLEPADRGKVIVTDRFRLTLLDVRTDVIDNAFAPVKKVFLVKALVESTTAKSLALGQDDVDLTRNEPGADRLRKRHLHYKRDLFYPRAKMCVDLAADVKPGLVPPGAGAIGYFAFQAPDAPAFESLWLDARSAPPRAPSRRRTSEVMGTLRVR